MLDRCGKHFGTILNFLRDGNVCLPDSVRELSELQVYICLNICVPITYYFDCELILSGVLGKRSGPSTFFLTKCNLGDQFPSKIETE